MDNAQIHVYFVPGLAAGKEIFRNLTFSETKYQIHILEWLIPEKSESIVDYAKRMAVKVMEPNAVLVGVSFGGVVAQEMSVFLHLRKLIIVSSVKTKKELPKRLKVARKTFAYKLIPTSLVLSASDITKFGIGLKTKKRLKLYQEYLHVRDKRYLDWAIKNMITWNREEKIGGVVHLHGDSDIVFPVRNIDQYIAIEGGTHIMILNRGAEVSEKLMEIIDNN